MNDTTLFAFEDDFVATLRCIPMAVRFKLDGCGIKLSLRQWSRLNKAERTELLLRTCDQETDVEAYRAYLTGLLKTHDGGEVKPLPPGSTVPWDQPAKTPVAVRLFAEAVRVTPPSNGEWAALTSLQRFVLLKLSRDNHDNVNFIPALREFGLGHAMRPEASYAASA